MRRLIACVALLAMAPARADDTMPAAPYAWTQLPNPAQEAKARALMATIRCLQCQSQSIIDSNASIAGDMRSQIRTRIAAGEDPEAIRHWLIQRYGDYVTYAPQLDRVTWPLFAAPLLLVLVACAMLARRLRKGTR